jgi:hypothetical protein
MQGGLMKKAELRSEARLRQTRKGTVVVAGATSPCLIQDMSTKGFLLMSTQDFSIGEVLELSTELYPGQVLKCKVEVRRRDEDCYGTMIVEISEASARLCRQFVEEIYSDRLKFAGRQG